MPSQPIVFSGLVLGRQKRGDKFLGYTVLSPIHGKRLVLKRISSKPKSSNALDLFDEGEFTADEKGESESCFLKEFTLYKRRTEIALNYASFQLATRFAQLVIRNPIHEENAGSAFELIQRSLNAWQSKHAPEAVYLKSLYLYCRDEGYAMKAEWYPKLNPQDASTARHVLNTSLAQIQSDKTQIARCIEQLEHYVEHSTHIDIAW